MKKLVICIALGMVGSTMSMLVENFDPETHSPMLSSMQALSARLDNARVVLQGSNVVGLQTSDGSTTLTGDAKTQLAALQALLPNLPFSPSTNDLCPWH